MEEVVEWVRIESHPDYEVSNTGLVRGLKGLIKGNLKSFESGKSRYIRVGLRKNRKKEMLSIHRLVATYFCKNPNNYDTTDHIDRDRSNNHYTNLRWVPKVGNANNKGNSGSIRWRYGKYEVAFKYANKSYYCGRYDNLEDAIQAYKTKVIEVGGDKWIDLDSVEFNPVIKDDKGEILEKVKSHYNANKEVISAYQREKIPCECGAVVARTGMAIHRRTKKHNKLINKLEN